MNKDGPETIKRTKGLETSRRILEVAAELFARNGYDGVSLQQIARGVGIKESSLYNHFHSKAAILNCLFDLFAEQMPAARPDYAELAQMLMLMRPEAVFKSILIRFGQQAGAVLENTAVVINHEKYRNARAADVYFRYIVKDTADYYERLIKQMASRGLIANIDARAFAEQYNYVLISLTKEYFMAKNGLADKEHVLAAMAKAIDFFCGLMITKDSPADEKET